MVKLRKVFCSALAMAMAISAVGCGGTKKATNEEEVPTLVWYMFGENQTDVASVMEEANKIIEPAIGAKLELSFIDSAAYTEKMKMKMASREKFDLCFVGFNNPYKSGFENGGLAELDDLIDEYAPEIYDNVSSKFIEDARIDGKLYAIPNEQVAFRQDSTFVQTDLLNKSGVTFNEINKMSDLEPFLQYVKENTENIPWRISYGIGMWTIQNYETIINDIVIKNDGSSKKAVNLRTTPEFQEGLNTIREWYLKGYIRQDVSTTQDDEIDVSSGKYASFQSAWKPGSEANMKAKYGRDYTAVKMMDPYLSCGFSRSTMIGIGECSEHKDKAIQLISLVNKNKDLYNLLCYGIEGKHYKLDSEGKVEMISDSGYDCSGRAWAHGNQFNPLVMAGSSDDVWEETKKLNEEAKVSPIIGFELDTEPIQNEISQVSSLLEEYGVMHRGYRDPSEYWDEMEQRLKTAGEDKILEEVNRQLDEFFANKGE